MEKAMQHLKEFCSKQNGEADNQITAANTEDNTVFIEFQCGRLFWVLVHDTSIGMSRIYASHSAIPATI